MLESKSVINQVTNVSFDQYDKMMSRHPEYKGLPDAEKQAEYQKFLNNLKKVVGV